MNEPWDCIVVGGGAAGLSAALVLGRARKRTLVVDAGAPSNLVAHGIGGLLGQDGRPPAELYADGRAELERYGSVEVRIGEAVTASTDLEVTLADGSTERAKRLLLATGMDYRYVEVPGAAERWGSSVFHCPFCHGWEVRDRALAVLDPDAATGVRRALLLRTWSDDVTLLTHGTTTVSDEDRQALAAAGVTVEERPVAALHGPESELAEVELADGDRLRCEGLLVAVTMHQRSGLASSLGVDLAESGPPNVERVTVDAMFETNVPGVFAAGDVAAGMPSVANAISAGSTAAAMIVHSLL